MLAEVSQSSKYSVLPMLVVNSFDFFAERIEFLSLVQILYQRVPVRVNLELLNQYFLRFPCDSMLLCGRLSEEYLEFCNQRYRDKFPCTFLAEFLRDAFDVCP